MDNLVLSNIAHRPARTLTSVLGIAVGVLLILFTTGLANGLLRERGRREAGINAEIIVRPSGTFGLGGSQVLTLDASLAERIERVEGVRAAVAIGINAVASDAGFGQRLIDGVPFDDYAALTNLRIIEGRGLSAAGDEAIITTSWQNQRAARVGETVELYERPFRIVGVYDPPGGSFIKIPLRTMQEQAGGEGRASTVIVACANPAEQEEIARRINERFPDHQIILTRDLPELYATGTPALNVFLNVVVGVAATISLLVILLAMYTTVTERTRQIGILKSLGMSNGRIAWIIEQEAIFVSLLGVILGVALTFAARFAVMQTTTLVIEVEWRWVAVSLLIGLLGGTLGAIYPALRAARQDVVKALSYE